MTTVSTFRQGWRAERTHKARAPRKPRMPFLAVLGRLLGRLIPSFGAARRVTLTVGGLGSICYGTWTQLGAAAGWIAIGVCTLLLDFVIGGDE